MLKKKNNILWIAMFVLVAILAVGVVFSIVKTTNIDKVNTISASPIGWKIGKLDEDGQYVKDTSVMMTREQLPLSGLKVEVVAKPSVEVFVGIFDKDDNLLNGTEVEGVLVPYQIETDSEKATTFDYAEYAETLELEEGVKPAYAIVFVDPINDIEISTLEITQYAKQVTVSHNR